MTMDWTTARDAFCHSSQGFVRAVASDRLGVRR
jgi:hypothetical protein